MSNLNAGVESEQVIKRNFQCCFWRRMLCHTHFQCSWLKKGHILQLVDFSTSQSQSLVSSKSFLSSFTFSSGWMSSFSGIKFKIVSCFNETMSSLAVSTKSFFFFKKVAFLTNFWPTGLRFKIDFANVKANYKEIHGQFLVGDWLKQKQCVSIWTFYKWD